MVFGIINYHWLSLHDKEQLGPESGFPLRSHLKTYSADIISVCLPPPWLLWFSLSLFLTRPCLSHPDIPVFVLYCLTLSFEAAFTSVRSRGFYTQLFLKGDELLCLVLRSPSPLFGAPLIFQYHLSVFYFHDTLSPVRMPWLIRCRPCATMFQLAFLRWPSIANTLLQCFPYGRRGESGLPSSEIYWPHIDVLGRCRLIWHGRHCFASLGGGVLWPNETLFRPFAKKKPSKLQALGLSGATSTELGNLA